MAGVAETPQVDYHYERRGKYMRFDVAALPWAVREGRYLKLDVDAVEVERSGTKYIRVVSHA